jgi:two-component system NtrC family sensor kinase
MSNTAGARVAPRPAGDPSDAEFSLSDAELRLVADSIPHVVWVAGQDGATEYLNRWALDYAGAELDMHNDLDWVNAVHPDDVAVSASTWQRASGAGEPYEVDCRLRRADGQFRWHRFRNKPLRDADGRVVKWIGTATDIEDQKVLEESLRHSERETVDTLNMLETLLAAAPVGIGLVDCEFRLVRMNDMFATMTGAPAAQQIGRTVQDITPDLWPVLAPIYQGVRDTGEAVLNLEVSGVLLAGSDRARSWLSSYYPVRAGTEIIGVGVAVVDITERTEAEEFRSVVMENMAEGLYTVDDDGILLSMNRAACHLLGWQEAELRGRDMHATVRFQSLDGGSLPQVGASAGAADEGPATRMAQASVSRKDGRVFPIAYSVAPLKVGSTVGGLVVVFRDATEQQERQQREIASRHDQKLESLGRLSAGIAHEINTPIQFVGDNTRFLASSCQQMLDLLLVYRKCVGPDAGAIPWEERRKLTTDAELQADVDYLAEEVPIAVSQSLEGIERVASLVRAMKSFTYKDSNDRSYADLNEAVATTLTVARNEVKYVADVTLDLGELPDVLCQVGDLNQVFLNLLVNAADAMQGREGRGEIKIRTHADGPMAVISIADNGSGVPEELQAVIFEPFFTTKDVGKGTGQGLALARAVVVDKHGGTIEVTSAPGQGTEFVLRLPIEGNRATT